MRLSRTIPCAALALAVVVACSLVLGSPTEARAESKTTLAVLYFDYNGSSEELGFLRKGLAQMLVTDLVDIPGISVVERMKLEEILKELDLNKTRRIDRRSALRIGKLLGARYLVAGSYTVYKETMILSLRIFDVETGEIVIGRQNYKGTFDEFFELEQKVAARLRELIGERLKSRQAERTSRKGDRTREGRKSAKSRKSAKGRKGTATGGRSAGKKLKKPKKLTARQASRYGKALDKIDKGDKKAARAELEAIVKEQPDFELAAVDLAGLSQ